MGATTVNDLAITEEALSDLISLRQQNTLRSNISKAPSLLSKMITRHDTKKSSLLAMQVNSGPSKSSTLLPQDMRGARSRRREDIVDMSQENLDGSAMKIEEELTGSPRGGMASPLQITEHNLNLTDQTISAEVAAR